MKKDLKEKAKNIVEGEYADTPSAMLRYCGLGGPVNFNQFFLLGNKFCKNGGPGSACMKMSYYLEG